MQLDHSASRNHYTISPLVHCAFEHLLHTFYVVCVISRCFALCRYDESLWRRLDLGEKILTAGVLGDHVLTRGPEFLRLAQTEVRQMIS